MQLSRALRLEPGKMLVFVGAGGKTSAIRRISQEVNGPILLATTTHLGRDQVDLAELHWDHEALVAGEQPELDPERLAKNLRSGQRVLLTGPLTDDGARWTSFPIDQQLVSLAAEAGAPLLVEADGARQRSFKAPADHEPALPEGVEDFTLVLIAGLDVLGQPIDSPRVHRPERVAALLEIDPSTTLGPDELAAVLGSERGGLKNVPSTATVRVLLTKATPERLPAARQIAELLLQNDRINSVVIAELTADDPVLEAHARVAGVVLAAGGSSRLGEPKQMVEWRGHPLVWHAVRAALEGGLSPVVVVVGQAAQQVLEALVDEPMLLTENIDWQEGQSYSVRTAMAALAGVRGVEAAVMLLADMPFVDAAVVRAVVQRYRETYAPLVAPYTMGRRANPVLFDRETFDDLRQLDGDQGGRALFERYPHEQVEWDYSITFDLDTPEDLERLREME